LSTVSFQSCIIPFIGPRLIVLAAGMAVATPGAAGVAAFAGSGFFLPIPNM
jgi:hypothetical protein